MSLSGIFPVENSSIYMRFLEEQEHIKKNRWFMGEKEKRPISWEEAKWNWIIHYRDNWIKSLQSGIK